MNVAVLLPKSSQSELERFTNNMSPNLKAKMNLHACFVDYRWRNYPINEMRNIAKADVSTKWTFILDADENTVFSQDVYLEEIERVAGGYNLKKTVFPVTSWQLSSRGGQSHFPTSKASLQDMKNSGLVELKASHVPVAYSPPGLGVNRWFSLSSAQQIRFSDGYEPYYLALTGAIPDFDPRFRGWGGNKCIQSFQMALDRYKFILLPTVFTFVPDTTDQAKRHSPPPDPYLIDRAWAELGRSRGCSSCTFWGCVQNCPHLLDGNSAAASSAAALGAPTMNTLMNTAEPNPIAKMGSLAAIPLVKMDAIPVVKVDAIPQVKMDAPNSPPKSQ